MNRSRSGANKVVRGMGNIFLNLDLFGQEVQLNIGGKSNIPSKYGACVSINIMIVFIMYCVLRAFQLLLRKEISLTEITLHEFKNSSNIFDLHQ